MDEEAPTGKEYVRQVREHVEARESGVIAERYREFALSVAPLRD